MGDGFLVGDGFIISSDGLFVNDATVSVSVVVAWRNSVLFLAAAETAGHQEESTGEAKDKDGAKERPSTICEMRVDVCKVLDDDAIDVAIDENVGDEGGGGESETDEGKHRGDELEDALVVRYDAHNESEKGDNDGRQEEGDKDLVEIVVDQDSAVFGEITAIGNLVAKGGIATVEYAGSIGALAVAPNADGGVRDCVRVADVQVKTKQVDIANKGCILYGADQDKELGHKGQQGEKDRSDGEQHDFKVSSLEA